jgi:hypothetical protein
MSIPIDEAIELWSSVETKSWMSLFDLTTEMLNRPEGMDNTDLSQVQDLAQTMGDEPFPQDFDDFYQMLNDRVQD